MKRYESKPNRTSRGLRLKAAGILCCLAVLAGCGNETLPAAAAKGTRTEWTASAEPEAAVDERTVLFEDTEEGLKAELASGKGQVIVTAGEAFGDGLIQLLCPDGMRIPCPFTASGREVVLSLPGEGGTFRLDILKRTENTGKYAYVCSSSFDAGETDGYTPFLLPSYYVNWSSDGPVANKAAELAAESSSDLEFAGKVSSQYEYWYDLYDTETGKYIRIRMWERHEFSREFTGGGVLTPVSVNGNPGFQYLDVQRNQCILCWDNGCYLCTIYAPPDEQEILLPAAEALAPESN